MHSTRHLDNTATGPPRQADPPILRIAKPDPLEVLDDWLFVTPPGTANDLARLAMEGDVRLDVEPWSVAALDDKVRRRQVIVVSLDTADGRIEGAAIVKKCLAAGASVVRTWTPVGLGDPETPTMVEWAAHHAIGLTLAIDRPWLAPAEPAEPDIDLIPIIDRWPRLQMAARQGIAGEIVSVIEPHSEADPVAVLAQLLVAVGNMTGRHLHFAVGATKHHLSLFAVVVGSTAVGRKGTSWDPVRYVVGMVDHEWAASRIQSGLSTGEGLIYHVRDDRYRDIEQTDKRTGFATRARVLDDAGVADKRLLVIESEFARVLKVMSRESNTLSDVIRQAWDSGQLRTLSKTTACAATDAHVSIVAHATQADIARYLTATDSLNGFANRFLWIYARRSKLLPDGGDLFAVDWLPIRDLLMDVVRWARSENTGRMTRDAAASRVWREIYPRLSEGKPGLLGAILSRAEAQVMRIACVYAMLDRSLLVRAEHLSAAVALWEYTEASARLIFGDGATDPDVTRLLDALRAAPDGLTRTQVSGDVFRRNKPAPKLAAMIERLLTAGTIRRERVKGDSDRSVERFFLA